MVTNRRRPSRALSHGPAGRHVPERRLNPVRGAAHCVAHGVQKHRLEQLRGARGERGSTFLVSLFEIKGVLAALLCQAAEHEYCNVLCGIKDRFISSCGR
ncbi:hypothetical protein PF008_g19813 [Phytophthora fragariae]|uniref:Uncharacterized protein n=1 Tax=Phytophthora fragariae TaxID=53985 RepID=A0A6G0R1A5_9STRA|nr:hypothetical protein PF008_g19813 [Phytophthora fragariae]